MICETNHIIGFRIKTSGIMRMSEAECYVVDDDFIPFKYCPECGHKLRQFVKIIEEERKEYLPKVIDK